MTRTEVDLGSLFTSVVGGQHHSARLSAGESVRLVREPENPHDANAIRVENLAGEKVGHLPGHPQSRLRTRGGGRGIPRSGSGRLEAGRRPGKPRGRRSFGKVGIVLE